MTVSPIIKSSGVLNNSQGKPGSPSKKTNNSGITIKRKPSTNNGSNSASSGPQKKTKKPTSNSNLNISPKGNLKNPSPVLSTSSFDLEVTICPICDEACTCPKTTSTAIPKSPKSLISKSNTNTTTTNTPSQASSKSKKSKEKPKYANNSRKKQLKAYEISDSSAYEHEDDEDDFEATREDPALSFIRMIYSDEESLDEEEAYALYQATQLFTSSDDEDRQMISHAESEDEYTTDDSDSDQFEYTVVEYVQPIKKVTKKATKFITYNSDDDNDTDNDHVTNDQDEAMLSASLQDQLLLNATEEVESSGSVDDEDYSSTESCDDEDDDGNWLTYSVFDIDSDLPNLTGGIGGTSLSSHGSGTPDTLLFSTSSTDKIPNIAPQVLAAISAAAKHMAATNPSNPSNATPTSKYFSYITLKENEDANKEAEEFLFFEENPSDLEDLEHVTVDSVESVDSVDSVESGFDSIDSSCDSINSLDSLSDGGDIDIDTLPTHPVDEDSFSDESLDTKKRPRSSTVSRRCTVPQNLKSAAAASQLTTTVATDFVTNMNRWNRIPIGTFRRSRRPSIPSYHHSINPSAALKTFSFSADPASLTLTPAPIDDHSVEIPAGPDGPERSYSVVTWDELDLDIAPPANNPVSSTNSSPTQQQSHPWPLPKRSRSVINMTNNYEWLNNSNWNWEN